MIQNTYLIKYITSQCSKLSACLRSIQSGKLVIMFFIPVALVDFKHVFAHISAQIKKSFGYITCEDVGGGDL